MENKDAGNQQIQTETPAEDPAALSSVSRFAKGKKQGKFGDVVRKYRTRAKISQKELCKKLGVSSAYLCQIETNRMKPGIDVVVPLCEYLNIPLNEFFGLKKTGEDLAPEEIEVLRAFRKASPAVRRSILTLLTGTPATEAVVQYPTGGIPEALTLHETGTPQKRGRGRPRKTPVVPEDEQKPKRGRGRPRKTPLEPENDQKPKRGRGRPRKEQTDVLKERD